MTSKHLNSSRGKCKNCGYPKINRIHRTGGKCKKFLAEDEGYESDIITGDPLPKDDSKHLNSRGKCKCGHSYIHYHRDNTDEWCNHWTTDKEGKIVYCKCKKFLAEDDVDIFMKNKAMMDKAIYDKDDELLAEGLGIKQKKGCGGDFSYGKTKAICGEDNWFCHSCSDRLCPECSPQSPQVITSKKSHFIQPEDTQTLSSKINGIDYCPQCQLSINIEFIPKEDVKTFIAHVLDVGLFSLQQDRIKELAGSKLVKGNST